MSVTYVERYIGTTKVDFPVLHKVVYKVRGPNNWSGSSPVWTTANFYEMEQWLKDNCQHPYYHGGAWERDCFIEFECDEDAMLFALRWV